MMQDPEMPDTLARGRFMALQLLRLSGIALVIFGLLVVNGKIAVPQIAGYVLIAMGVADALFVPAFLARRWKSPAP